MKKSLKFVSLLIIAIVVAAFFVLIFLYSSNVENEIPVVSFVGKKLSLNFDRDITEDTFQTEDAVQSENAVERQSKEEKGEKPSSDNADGEEVSSNGEDQDEEPKEKEEQSVYADSKARFKLTIPEGWTYDRYTYADGTDVAGFYPSGKSAGYEYRGDILIVVRSNPEKLSLQEFYKQEGQVNLFEDASGGVSNVKVGGRSGKKFSGVIGMFASTIVSVAKDDYVVEIDDVSELHLEDGIFDGFINDFEWL
ncbi:MAG: hypothetical protein ACD_63C00054G0008 [uncultured bacterium]|nr:MAG: hypothetical protein ACD_63C00054G0008 [uncultured bacterium]